LTQSGRHAAVSKSFYRIFDQVYFLKTSSVKDIVEIAGITAVVVSLGFVGLELRQSQKIAVASQYQSRIGFNLDFFESLGEQDLHDLGDRTKRRVNESSISAELKQALLQMDTASLGRAAVAAQKILYIFDNNHYQYRAGFLDEEAWRATRRRIKTVVKERPIMQFEIVGRSFQWRESLHQEFQQILKEIKKAE
jgi:hypothetical protein